MAQGFELRLDQVAQLYEMRLESIGGLGAHLAGQILAEAGVLGMGLSGMHFSSYGSEKKGSPIKSYVRLGPPGRTMRTASSIRQPDLIAVFHEALLKDPGVTAGLRPGGTLVVNSTESPEEIAERVRIPGIRVLTVDCIRIALQEKTRVNTAILGAISVGAQVPDRESVRQAITETFAKKYPHLVEANLRTYERGAAEVREYRAPAEYPEGAGTVKLAHGGPVVGWQTAPTGGLLPSDGSSARKDVSASRQGTMPVLSAERCVNCGICDLVCPDFCFVWRPTGETVGGQSVLNLVGIDYQYCKGCMHCVQECPTGALTEERESRGLAARLRVPLFEDRVVESTAAAGRGR